MFNLVFYRSSGFGTLSQRSVYFWFFIPKEAYAALSLRKNFYALFMATMLKFKKFVFYILELLYHFFGYLISIYIGLLLFATFVNPEEGKMFWDACSYSVLSELFNSCSFLTKVLVVLSSTAWAVKGLYEVWHGPFLTSLRKLFFP